MDPMTPPDGDGWRTITLSYPQWCALRAHLAEQDDRGGYSPLATAKEQVQRTISASAPSAQFTESEVRAMFDKQPNMVTESPDLAYAYAELQNALAS